MASKAVLLAAAVVASAFVLATAESKLSGELATAEAKFGKLGGELATAEAKFGKLGGEFATAEAKIGKLGGELATAEAKFGKIGGEFGKLGKKLGKLVISGVVPCNTGSLIDIATSPAFPNADVELRCMGKMVAGATTNTNGSFTIEADLTNAMLAFIGGCTLVVDTPLIKCNVNLDDVGSLVSYLQGPLTRLIGGIFHLSPAGFSFHARKS